MADAIVNKIANSGLITLNLEAYLPKEQSAIFDLKDHLFMGLILKEKDFREALKNFDWSVYQDKMWQCIAVLMLLFQPGLLCL